MKRDALLFIGTVFVICAFCVYACSARAHDYSHPELKSWFMGLHNQQGTPCCDGDDAVHVEDADWDTQCKDSVCRYRVRLEGKWYDVPDNAVVTSKNLSGTALVWPIRYGGLPGSDTTYAIRCFMPGSGT